VTRSHRALLRLAEALIAAGVLLGVLAFTARALGARIGLLRAFEGGAPGEPAAEAARARGSSPEASAEWHR